jgi:hypothetical protein
LSPYAAKYFVTSLFRVQRNRHYLAPAFLFFFFAPCDFAWNPFASQADSAKNLPVFQSIIHAGEMSENRPAAWHIRLSVAMPSKGLTDSMNTLGVSPAGSSGRDRLDIPDQPRPPWAEPYLDLVFPHPEWGGGLTDFSSDFRHGGTGQKKTESWRFEVRSNILNEEVIFSWHGPAQILAHCRLRDAESKRLLVADPVRNGYAFIMTAPRHEFIWEYHYQPMNAQYHDRSSIPLTMLLTARLLES